MREHDTDPAPAPSGSVRAHGRGWSVVVPAAVVCAVTTAITNWALRPTTEARAASPADAETRQDIRELRADVKQILSRLGGLEDAVNNQRVIDGARGKAGQ